MSTLPRACAPQTSNYITESGFREGPCLFNTLLTQIKTFHLVKYSKSCIFSQVDLTLRMTVFKTKLPAISAIVVLNDSVLWNGNFGKRNISDPSSPAPNEYTVYR